MAEKVLLNKDSISDIITSLAGKIYSDISSIDQFAIVGVQTRGVELAERIRAEIERISGKSIPMGIIDITLFRDDIATRGVLPVVKETRIDFDIAQKTILLVDDVLYTGRTVKAALETLMSFGRPAIIRLFELIDREHRELPIQADYCGHKIATKLGDKVKVRLQKTDNIEDVVILDSAD